MAEAHGLCGVDATERSGADGAGSARIVWVHEGAAMHHPRLQPWLTRRLSELSDGQKQQVMVARAMLQSQSWIVLDEPTAFWM